MAVENLTAQRLRELLHYDPETGLFTRRIAHYGHPAGSAIGSTHNVGYVRLHVDGRSYLAHRLAWLYMTGEWPEQQVDHRDGDRANNRFENLRDVTRSVNFQNQRRARGNNKHSALLGAFKKRDRWESRIKVDGAYIRLGTFRTAEEAHTAYIEAKRRLHPGCTI
jgi:hypothetical protein